jgi:hypothetical protein
MSFEYEDKMAWLNSEIMREFEKIATETDIFNPPDAFLPVEKEDEDDKSFEDEDEPERQLEKAVETFLEPENKVLRNEFSSLCKDNLLTNLQDLACEMAERGRMKVAFRIERAIYAIKAEEK